MNTQDIQQTAAQFNARHRWDVNHAQALAREVLTDCNAHAEVRLMDAGPEMVDALKDCAESLSRLPDVEGAYRVTCLQQAWAILAKIGGAK